MLSVSNNKQYEEEKMTNKYAKMDVMTLIFLVALWPENDNPDDMK